MEYCKDKYLSCGDDNKVGCEEFRVQIYFKSFLSPTLF